MAESTAGEAHHLVVTRPVEPRRENAAPHGGLLLHPGGQDSAALKQRVGERDLDALTESNVSQAQVVIAADQQIDRDYRAVQKQLKQEIVREPDRVNTWLRLVNTARNLERIADHAAKIAESVIYLKEGEILRHRAAASTNDPGFNSTPPSSPSFPSANSVS